VKAVFLSHLYIKPNILPRQARDKHRENSPKKTTVFPQVMNPMPYSNAKSPPEFPPPCNETVDRKKSDTGRCSGRDPFDVLVLNDLRVPQNIKPGEVSLSKTLGF
jgi:hypothetical protein